MGRSNDSRTMLRSCPGPIGFSLLLSPSGNEWTNSACRMSTCHSCGCQVNGVARTAKVKHTWLVYSGNLYDTSSLTPTNTGPPVKSIHPFDPIQPDPQCRLRYTSTCSVSRPRKSFSGKLVSKNLYWVKFTKSLSIIYFYRRGSLYLFGSSLQN